MDVRPIRTDADHEAALRRIEALWGAPMGSPEGDELDVLVTLVEAYEEQHFPMPEADPIGVIRSIMEQKGLTQSDLARVVGSRSRASEILNRKRSLTVDQIRAIRAEWRVPADALI